MAVQLPKTIRQWFTPEQACQYLSQAFECEVTVDDINYFTDKNELSRYFKVMDKFWFLHMRQDKWCGLSKPYWYESVELTYLIEDEIEREQIFEKLNLNLREPERIVSVDLIEAKEYKVLPASIFESSSQIFLDAFSIKKIYARSIEDIKLRRFTNFIALNGSGDKYAIPVAVNTGEIGYPRHELDRFIKTQTEPIPEPQEIKDLNPTERDALHNIIKALANMVIDPTAPKEKEKSDEQRGKPPFKNQTQLIEFLSDKESGLGEWRGLSKPNLEKVFAKANKTDSP